MKRAIYLTAIIFLISFIFISFSRNAAIALQESSESIEEEVKEYNPEYNVKEEPVDEDQEVYIKPDTEAIPDTEVEDEQEEDRYWWEDEQSNSEETIIEDSNQQSHE